MYVPSYASPDFEMIIPELKSSPFDFTFRVVFGLHAALPFSMIFLPRAL